MTNFLEIFLYLVESYKDVEGMIVNSQIESSVWCSFSDIKYIEKWVIICQKALLSVSLSL